MQIIMLQEQIMKNIWKVINETPTIIFLAKLVFIDVK